MSHRILTLFALVIFSPGCIPVTEPVGDIDKAEPDKALLGTWVLAEKQTPEMNKVKIELAPKVKGNPKGLMLMTFLGYPFPKEGTQFFFYLTTIGKEQYGNLLLDINDLRRLKIAHFNKEGEYDKWSKGTGRRYLVFRTAATKDGLIINWGDEVAFKALMKDEKIPQDDKNLSTEDKKIFSFQTPAGWLAKYLEKNGRAKIFPADADGKFVKEN
jgi:hypothetical protein